MGQLEDRTFSKFFTVPFVRPRVSKIEGINIQGDYSQH